MLELNKVRRIAIRLGIRLKPLTEANDYDICVASFNDAHIAKTKRALRQEYSQIELFEDRFCSENEYDEIVKQY